MKIAYKSDILIPSVQKVISVLTDKAQVFLKGINYDEARGIVDIFIQRKELIEFKKSFLGEMKPIYSQKMIESLLTIKQVEEMELKVDDRLVANCNSCFTILFGVKVDDKQLYLGSVEEIQGDILCQIFIKVNQMNIEFNDLDETEFNIVT